MEKITSFTIDHIKLQPGVYVSRKDPVGNSVITTFDIRMTSPNEEPVMNTAELHTIEHLAATFLRNHKEFGPKMIYWGPMGCRTGNYLLLNGTIRMNLRILFRLWLKPLSLSVISRARFLVLPRKIVEIIWI